MAIKRIGILTGGGDVPGLNSVIKGVTYRAYEAENPEALRNAIDEVNRLENLPITYIDTLPRRDLAPWCHALALLAVAGLLAASLTEIRTWRA